MRSPRGIGRRLKRGEHAGGAQHPRQGAGRTRLAAHKNLAAQAIAFDLCPVDPIFLGQDTPRDIIVHLHEAAVTALQMPDLAKLIHARPGLYYL